MVMIRTFIHISQWYVYNVSVEEKFIPAFSYDILTPLYDSTLKLLGFGTKQREKIIDLLDLEPNERLLDVGCGTASLLVAAKSRFPNVEMTGVDIDKKVLSIAQSKLQKNSLDVELINTGAQKLPFPDSSFDVIVSTLIFHHLPTEIKKQALGEIYRVLKKDGRFLLVDFGKLDGFLRFIYYIEVVLQIPEHRTARDNVEGKMPGFLNEAGFKIKEVAPQYRGIQYLLANK